MIKNVKTTRLHSADAGVLNHTESCQPSSDVLTGDATSELFEGNQIEI